MELYHLLNRGVEKRNVVMDESDHIRFIHDLYMLNDKNTVDPNHRFRDVSARKERIPLVQIHAYCLMPNHYHFLVSEEDEGGISLFMRKFNMGYAKYFNEKYERSGVLWQGIFKKILIHRDAHFLYIPFYIHLNPLDLILPEWRTGNVKNFKKALEHLGTYRWSSYLDYNGMHNFPSLINQEFLSDVLGSSERQHGVIKDIISGQSITNTTEFIE